MRIVFMGTPTFAVPTLEKLAQSSHDLVLVVSQPDAKRDRGEKVKPTPVKQKAIELGIPVEQPEQIKENPIFLRALQALKPDLIVVAAYGKILPKEILQLPPKGCINIHGSLLPKYRGAAPIQRAVLEGASMTGVTLMEMGEGLDSGDMLACAKTTIDGKTAAMLHDELAEMGAGLLYDSLPLIEANQMVGIPQNHEEATYAPMIYKKDGLVDFNHSAVDIERQIRGMNPWPRAYTQYKGAPMKLLAGVVKPKITPDVPGKILDVSDQGIAIATGEGILVVTEIQMPGKKKMPVSDYIRGNQIEINTILG